MVEIALSPLHDQGQPYVVAAIRDIASYPRVQQALRRARYSEHLAQLGRLAVDERQSQVVLDHGPSIAAQALQADAAMLFLLDGNGLEFTLVSGVGLLHGDTIGMAVPNRADTLPGHVLRQGRAVVISDDDAGFTLPDNCRAAGMQAMLAVPLSDRGRTTGLMVVAAVLVGLDAGGPRMFGIPAAAGIAGLGAFGAFLAAWPRR